MDAFHPIIYVRGYAMSESEINETTADPFCGFNTGSTVFRATADRTRPPRKFIFESPLVRLVSDFEYGDIYSDGRDIGDAEWTGCIARRSIIVYRYYDSASSLLGDGETPPIERFAEGLSALILRVRDLVCGDPANETDEAGFRCYLVAHSMGGLVCRAMLQNPGLDTGGAKKYVDKFFTFATPHNGIEVLGMNVPTWLSANDISNFSRERMAQYLKLDAVYKKTKRVDVLPQKAFPAERVFCLIGTNRSDYEAARGASRTFVGHGSDGLVRIENAALWGTGTGAGAAGVPVAKAFVYRAHSGYFGIVNSEEAYQNLTRFLFGDVRIDIWVDLDAIRLPEPVAQAQEDGQKVNALYQIELLASPRGKLWYLTRRTAEEDSVACVTHEEWTAGEKRSLYLSTLFLSMRARVNMSRPSMAYSVTVGVRVPDYEIDKRLWINEHYEGGYLFRDSVVIELVPPETEGGEWVVRHDWQSGKPGRASTPLEANALASGKVELPVAFESDTTPGVAGRLRFIASAWNR